MWAFCSSIWPFSNAERSLEEAQGDSSVSLHDLIPYPSFPFFAIVLPFYLPSPYFFVQEEGSSDNKPKEEHNPLGPEVPPSRMLTRTKNPLTSSRAKPLLVVAPIEDPKGTAPARPAKPPSMLSPREEEEEKARKEKEEEEAKAREEEARKAMELEEEKEREREKATAIGSAKDDDEVWRPEEYSSDSEDTPAAKGSIASSL